MKSVFISSTFKDMQAERDYLHERVFSRLRKLVGQYGEDIQELDLRWGVDTYQMSEEESGYQVLKVCIDAIDRCKPYIIVLLGDRYGWIPDEKLVDSMRDMRLNEQYEASMSITNLEIKYGALSEEETLKRCIFCFRNSDFIEKVPEKLRAVYLAESPEHEKKLRVLKEQIRGKKDAKIIDYQVKWDEENQIVSGLEPLGEDIYRLLEEQLKNDLAGREAKSPIQQYILDARGTKERYLASYTPRLYEERKAVEAMTFMAGDVKMLYHSKYKAMRKNRQCMHLIGRAGCGKSALMAAIEQQAAEVGTETILYFSGNPGCQSVETLKSVIIYRLEEILSIPHDEACENKNAYLRILDEKVKGRLIYCFIDALDQLFANQQNLYLEIVGLCPNLYVITSALDTFPYKEALLGAVDIQVIEVRRFMNEEKRSLIQMTSTYRGKTMDDELKEKICAKESSDNPLFLSLILQRLFAMRKAEFEQAERLAPGIDGLHLYMERLIDDMPEKVMEAVVRLFEHVEEMFGSTFLKEVSYLIALSETGLAEREIEGILKQQSVEFSQIKFQEILFYLYDVFTENADGKWVYSHRIFQEAMRREAEYKEDEIRGYFIRYSELDSEFLKREGYYHILRSKNIRGREVLKECRTWATFGRVKNLVKQMLLEEEAAENYFLGMLEDTGIEELLKFWKSADSLREDKKIRTFLEKIYKICARRDELPPELRIEALYSVIEKGDPEDGIKQIRTARTLLSGMIDDDTRKLWGIKIEYMDAWNLIDAGKAEEGLALMKSAIDEVAGLFPNLESAGFAAGSSFQGCWRLEEEAIGLYIGYSRVYMLQNRKRFNVYLPQYLESSFALYDRYPKYTQVRRFQLLKIRLYIEGAMQYSKIIPERSKQYAGEAVELARRLSDEQPDSEVLELLARSLNYYGHDVDREHRYQYRYEALDVYKRIYQVEPTDYWKQEVAAQASFFAEDISSLVQQLKLDDRDGWIVKGRGAWKLCFSYYEELFEKGYEYASRADYVDSLLVRTTEEVYVYYTDDAVRHAKKACDCLKEDRENGWEPKSQKELFRCWHANALAAENLDDRLCADESVPYAYEAIEWAKRLYGQKASQQNLIYILVSLQVAARVLYHAGKDDEALAIAREAEEGIDYCQKEYHQRIPSVEYEICYIISRLSLKKKDTENARKYAKLLKEYDEGGQLDFWQKGQLLLLKGDLLFAEKEYETAKDIYVTAISHWREYHGAVKKNIRTTVGYQLRDGKITRDTAKRLWHVKTFYYYLYALLGKAETKYEGNLWERCYIPAVEYQDIYEMCIEGVKEEVYRPVAEGFMFRAIDRMLEFGKEAQWKGINSQEILSFLCQMIVYGKEKNLNMDRQYEVLADAFCHCDLYLLSTALAFLKEAENCWLDIYQYLKQKVDEGMVILPCNRYLIGYMWMRMGCYEEACLWLDAVPEKATRYEYAKLCGLFCHAMCARHDKEKEKFSEAMAELETLKRKGDEAWGGMLKRMYQELTGSVSDVLQMMPGRFYLQEEAQRYLNVLKMTADQGAYLSLNDRAKENFWIAAKEIRGAYYKWNERIPGKEDVKDRWEDRAAAMKELTAGGMTWQVSFAEIEEELYTVFRRIYDTCTDEEEKQKIAERIAEFWRMEYEKTDLKRLSIENLQMLRKTELVTGRALFPRLEEELAIRLDDKEILHEFFRKIPKYSEIDDWKKLPRPREMEIKDIFDRLLVQDVDEWAEDFKRWISGEMWLVGHMEFFKEPETLDMPQKRPVYEVYCQYQMKFKESSRVRWVENIKKCEMGQIS